MRKFQVGDTVKIVFGGSNNTGKTGIIVRQTLKHTGSDEYSSTVCHDDGSGESGWTFESSLEFIESEETAAINLLGEEYFA